MIYAVVAIDDKRGLANDKGIPWDLPTDRKYYRELVKDKDILMGYGTFVEFKVPMSSKQNLVATDQPITKPGFTAIADARSFLKNATKDIWVIGGAGLFATMWDMVDILYATRIEGDFGCTKFLPEFEDDFISQEKSTSQTENGINFRFETWKRQNT